MTARTIFTTLASILALGFNGSTVLAQRQDSSPVPNLAEAETIDETVQAICAEPHWGIQTSLIEGYFADLPAEDFPEALEALGRHEGWETSIYLRQLLYHWMRKDPDAAAATSEKLREIVVPFHLGMMGWYERDFEDPPKNLEALRNSPIWPDRSALNWRGRADTEEKKNETSFLQVRAVLDCPIEELPGILEVARQNGNSAAFVVGARRWISKKPEDAAKVFAVTDRLKRWRRSQKAEIVKAWGRVDPQAAWTWFEKNRPDDLQGFAGRGMIAFIDEQTRKDFIESTPENRRWFLFEGWAEEAPKIAFEEYLKRYGRIGYSYLAESVFGSAPRSRQVIEAIKTIETPVNSLQGGMMMLETWGILDAGEAARWSVDWLLDTGEFEREHLVRVWQALEQPHDESIDNRGLGCLRKWAMCQPEQMREWIGTLDAELSIRYALTWLLDHPNGGIMPFYEIDPNMRAVFEEPNSSVAHSQMMGLLADLRENDFPRALEALEKYEKREDSSYFRVLMEIWGERFPEAAWEALQPYFEVAVTDHFIDEWEERVIGPNQRDPFGQIHIRPRPRHLMNFRYGLEKAIVPPEVKERLHEAFEKKYLATFGKTAQDGSNYARRLPKSYQRSPSANAIGLSYVRLREIQEAPLEKLPGLLKVARDNDNLGALVAGIRRWIIEAPEDFQEILELAGEKHRTEAVRSRARLDPEGTWLWFEENDPAALDGFAGPGLIAFVDEEKRARLLDGAPQIFKGTRTGDDKPLYNLFVYWGFEDPGSALAEALRRGGHRYYSLLAEDAAYSHTAPALRDRAFDAITSNPVPVIHDAAMQIVEHWGKIDVGQAARYGVDWMRVTGEFPRDHLVRVWGGTENPEDGSMDDRTYGCLRKWAACEPEEMRDWIATLENEPAIQRALTWMIENPNGQPR